jgi:hypothetical protein
MNINDPAVLRKRIAELEMENKRLKEGDSSSSKAGFNTMRPGGASLAPPQQDKDWMNFGGSGSMALERPTTASSNSQLK